MRILLAAALLVTAPCLAQAQDLRLRYPADANRDGVITDDERADYAARTPVAALDIPATPPRSTKRFLTIGKAKPTDQLAPVDRPAQPSEFQRAMDLKDRRDHEKGD